MFKGIANIASMMRQAQQMGGKMKEAQEKLKHQRATGKSGGGMIEVEVNGLGEVLRVTIDPALVERGERDMIESLLPAAFNEAAAKAKQMHVELMTDGVDMPGLDEALQELTGGNPDIEV